ncbi:MAG TPA: hypothetical protein VGO51_12630 [Burkholderiaceae bacterium]|nr:hypothetical protein [Burkholderiaceae bacterium]
MRLHDDAFELVINVVGPLTGIFRAVSRLLKIVHASPDSIFIVKPLHDFSCLLGFLIELLKAVFQTHRYRGGGLTDLRGLINGLLFMIEAPLNFAGLHRASNSFSNVLC